MKKIVIYHKLENSLKTLFLYFTWISVFCSSFEDLIFYLIFRVFVLFNFSFNRWGCLFIIKLACSILFQLHCGLECFKTIIFCCSIVSANYRVLHLNFFGCLWNYLWNFGNICRHILKLVSLYRVSKKMLPPNLLLHFWIVVLIFKKICYNNDIFIVDPIMYWT